MAENNHLRKLSLRAPRGVLFDRGGKLLVETREALFDKGFFHATGVEELIHAAELKLELLIIHVAQDDGQSWTEGWLEGQDEGGGRRVFH